MRRLLCCLALLVFLGVAGGAMADISLAPQMAQWDTTLPMEIDLEADVKAHMPFDDARCAQLNAMLKHITLRLNTSRENAVQLGRVSVLVDDWEALWLTHRLDSEGSQLRLSWKEETYAATGDALASLVGMGNEEPSLYGLTGSEQQWLDDGAVMFSTAGESLEKYRKEESIKTTIKNMGTARKRITYSIPKGDVDVFVKALTDHCPEGALLSLLGEVTFSGPQKLMVWLNANGDTLRVEYAGKCGGSEDTLRNVSLVWRLNRAEDVVRDDVTLKTPAVKGNDYNTLTCTRDFTQDEKGVVTLQGKFSYSVNAGGQKTTLSGEADLKSAQEKSGSRLSGSFSVKQKLPGADYASGMVFMPDVLIDAKDAGPVVDGTVHVQEKQGDNVIEDAVISVKVKPSTPIKWDGDSLAVDVNDMTQAQASAMLEGMSAELLPHLVLLPAEDTLYLSADLPEKTWQGIVEAARSVLPEEETP